MCFGTAAAGAGPAWNAGAGSAPGLLWKLAAGDGGGGDSQRAPGGRSGGGGGAPGPSPTPRRRTRAASPRATRAIAGRGSGRVRTGGGSVGRGWRRCRVPRGERGGGQRDAPRAWLLAGLRRGAERTGLAPAVGARRSAAAAECGAGSASPSLAVPRPPAPLAISWPRRPVSAPWRPVRGVSGGFSAPAGEEPSVRAVGTGPRALPVGPGQVKLGGGPHHVPQARSPARPRGLSFFREVVPDLPSDAGAGG